MFFRGKPLTIRSGYLCLLNALYLVLLFNRSFWARANDYFHHDYAILAIIFIILTCLFMVLSVLLSLKYFLKPWIILLIATSAVASWFTDQFGTIIDRHMLVNVMETNRAEISYLLTPNFILYLLLTAFVPSLIILRLQIEYRPLIRMIWRNVLITILCLVMVVGLSLGISRTLLSSLREHHDLVRIINPLAPMVSAVKYVMREHVVSSPIFQPIGLDAKFVGAAQENQRPRIIVMVIGEAARAENFSLQGYHRQTNPQLEKRNIIYFGNVASCGTATAQSVPCMFSPLNRHGFDRRKAASVSSLPDILAQADIDVAWWENNSDSKGVADRIKQKIFHGGTDEAFCSGGECLDGIMLEPLKGWLDSRTKDAVLFVHQMGSHGPAYFRRYTDEFRQFRPDCRGIEFSQCSIEEVRNAYDNSLLYTDDFLSQIIDLLIERADKMETALLYMSDHGESLGENGLYLHGMPYALAPSQQTHIPFVMWLSPELTLTLKLDWNCLTKDAMSRSLSHDNLFPSLLGLMEIETEIKQNNLDILTPCRNK